MNQGPRRWLLGGGIGSGKTRVRELLAARGVNTIDSDSIGHEVIAPGGAAFDRVSQRWPETLSNGGIDRQKLAAIVFSDPTELSALEAITHPLIFEELSTRSAGVAGPVVVEIPVIREVAEDWRRLVVDADDEVRYERLLQRGMAPEDIRNRMASQPSRGDWLAVADLVIPNHGDEEELAELVDQLVELL
jgi:dephospho-CoA kinase